MALCSVSNQAPSYKFMKTPKRQFRITFAALLWSASSLVQPIAGFAQTTNQVLSLDGSGDYVSIPSAPDLQNPTQITIEAWIYPRQSSQNNTIFINKSDNINATSSRSYELQWVAAADSAGPGQSVRFIVFLSNGSWTFVDALAAESNWVHVAGCFSSSQGVLQLFTNGILAKMTTEASGTPLAGTSLRQTTLPVLFGRGDYAPYFYARGYMDEVRIWKTARTQAEVAGRMSCPLSGSEADLAGYWNFDAGTAADLTGSGHDGALFDNAAVVPMSGEDVIQPHSGSSRIGHSGNTTTTAPLEASLPWTWMYAMTITNPSNPLSSRRPVPCRCRSCALSPIPSSFPGR
jgi:hypothetical protein